ncbi:hypothetical protein QKU48_gp1372 [Fadolivirus algeromassiliense]|jgi:hypothetical protein|uniref:Uncharacterized protein n=1 Tax=Fadolivirus FV1/VV64 TaxID=3070911 RepID=A0A7D3UU33_9VIRU|nr:hypothetical protein QKU48_gp1372 [Fadolivirus algeromassiliense]QKF94830.1 hypothetical protein Fadolivirus_1_1372 [Fadolivirus FV1/VV64]
MKFVCGSCNYETDDKSNFNKHTKSNAHKSLLAKHANKLAGNANEKLPSKNSISCGCGKSFSHQSSLSRHQLKCNGINMQNQMTVLIDTVHEIKKQNDALRKQNLNLQKQLHTFVKNNKPTINNNYFSVKNYVQQNFPNAPALEGPKDYEKLTFEDNDLIDSLIYNYENEILHRYLGKFIISYYKKDDPSEQSLWTSDVSRLTYIIKELLESNKSIWSHDFKGVKVKMCIINPLLKYIRKCIDDYWIVNLDNMKSLDTKELVKLQEKFIALQKIKQDIGNEVIANNIIRYVAPHFYMEKKDTTLEEFVDMFIDSD